MRKYLVVVFLLLCSSGYSAEFTDVLDATCVVFGQEYERDGQKFHEQSTGTVIKETEDTYEILCAGHAACSFETVDVAFMTNGIFEKKIKAKVKKVVFSGDKDYIDFAILEIPKEVKVKPIKLKREMPELGQSYFSSCLHTNTIGIGYCRVFVVSENYFGVQPFPYSGTSGSPVLSKDLDGIYGIYILSDGMCVSSKYILAELEK